MSARELSQSIVYGLNRALANELRVQHKNLKMLEINGLGYKAALRIKIIFTLVIVIKLKKIFLNLN
jgi:hypothetical protein